MKYVCLGFFDEPALGAISPVRSGLRVFPDFPEQLIGTSSARRP